MPESNGIAMSYLVKEKEKLWISHIAQIFEILQIMGRNFRTKSGSRVFWNLEKTGKNLIQFHTWLPEREEIRSKTNIMEGIIIARSQQFFSDCVHTIYYFKCYQPILC